MRDRFALSENWPYRAWSLLALLPLVGSWIWVWSAHVDAGIVAGRLVSVAMVVAIVGMAYADWQVRADRPFLPRLLDRCWFAGLALGAFLLVWCVLSFLQEVDPSHTIIGILGLAGALTGAWLVYERRKRAEKPHGSVPSTGWGMGSLAAARRRTAIHELGHWIVIQANGSPVQAKISLRVPSDNIAGQVSWSAQAAPDAHWHQWRRLVHLGGAAAETLLLGTRPDDGCAEDLQRWEAAARLVLSHAPDAAWFMTPDNVHEAGANARALGAMRAAEFALATRILAANQALLDELLPILLRRDELADVELRTWATRVVPIHAMDVGGGQDLGSKPSPLSPPP